MNIANKQKLPLLFLISISIWWGFYYQSNSSLNNFGAANYEWLYLLDGLLVLPVLCFLCIEDKKLALLKALILSGLAVLVGSYIIPEPNKLVWNYLESARYLMIAGVVLVEIIAILTVYLAIKSALNKRLDPDLAISKPIQRLFGDSVFTQLLSFETRVWTYALFSTKINSHQFVGEKHFSYHHKDGAESNLLGFILLIVFEMPLMHLLLHFAWSPFAANAVTLLTLLSLIFFIAEYRAVSKRPISLTGDYLIIRYGVYQPDRILLANIECIDKNHQYIPRSQYTKRYNYAGNPNVVITLRHPHKNIKSLFLGVDNPEAFIDAVKQSKKRAT